MVDLDAAIGFVVAHGDAVDRARLSRLRSGAPVPPDVLDAAEAGQAPGGGWPAVLDGEVASVDATCFRLAELDDLGALGRPAARHALDWLAARQLPDGGWDEDPSLAGLAPEWATPGDPEARLYQTANAGFWLTVAGLDARAAGPLDHRVGGAYAGVVQAAAQALAARLAPDGSWPSFLPAGWLAAAVLHRQQMYYESARIQAVLADRILRMSPADVAWLAATLRRVDVGEEQWLLVSARRRLAETQRSDGGWDSDDGHQFDVHTTLRAIRACRPNTPEAPVSGAPFVVPQTAELPPPPAAPAPRPRRPDVGPDATSGSGTAPDPSAGVDVSAGPDNGQGPWSAWIVTPDLLPDESAGPAAHSVPDLPPGPVLPVRPPAVAVPPAASVAPGLPPLATPPPAPTAPTIASPPQPGTTPPVDPTAPADGDPLQLA
ncbi:prenyltransferase/squalene oxidase repeat-containing protein [Micromonospora sp. C28ISP2-4]|nr:prenyltransferase/squalene oxidase repeat-containing protein [Micromonospora sp. C28ISP2-4]MDO3684587.1 prenyltransferase/squalene oxidase repeat-containing protein [Micromonospora sp. C28ISP2-4]